MSDNRPTREECEQILAIPNYWICTKCGWHGADADLPSHKCNYSASEGHAIERKLARYCLALLDENANLRDKERQWMPIETAPKDGTPVLLYKNGFIGMHRFMDPFGSTCGEQWYYTDITRSCWVDAPTHWMPLPDPPAIESTASEGEPKA